MGTQERQVRGHCGGTQRRPRTGGEEGAEPRGAWKGSLQEGLTGGVSAAGREAQAFNFCAV